MPPTNSPISNSQKILYLIMFLLFISAPVNAVEKLFIETTTDTSYLPFRFKEIFTWDNRNNTKKISHTFGALDSQFDNEGRKRFLSVGNSAQSEDKPAIFSMYYYPSLLVIDDDPVNMIVRDWQLYDDAKAGLKAVIGCGYKNGSAWAFRLIPETEEFDKIFLANGQDGTGDDKWDPHIHIALVDDYDRDNLQEAFIMVNSDRDVGSRELFCIELETLSIEWSLPVASVVQPNGNVHSHIDSHDTTIIFVTYNCQHGNSDDNYYDLFGYLSIINNQGELIFNKVAKVGTYSLNLKKANTEGIYYLFHNANLLEPDSFIEQFFSDSSFAASFDKQCISKINHKGEIIASIEAPSRTCEMWLQDYGSINNALYIKYTDKTLRVYDENLNLIAESDPVAMGYYLDQIKIQNYDDAIILSDGIYTYDYKKLLHFPFGTGSYEFLEQDADGAVITLAIDAQNYFSIGHIEKKSFIDLARIFYIHNQSYILMLISGLIVGLVITNFFRRKTKHNLLLISQQKQELEETHKALRQAQQTIIEQEKFKQAKDIAGGFAHEIRNALFPGKTWLLKLKKQTGKAQTDKSSIDENIKRVDNAISRAVDMTNLISQYTKLESEIISEKVVLSKVIDDVIQANNARIEKEKVDVKYDIPQNIEINFGRRHFEIVINNLLLNSLDAFNNQSEERVINIDYRLIDSHIELQFMDNGSGISDENIHRIFDTFFSTKPNTGTGIGLALTKKIIELYNGVISVKSEIGRGTTFTIRLKSV